MLATTGRGGGEPQAKRQKQSCQNASISGLEIRQAAGVANSAAIVLREVLEEAGDGFLSQQNKRKLEAVLPALEAVSKQAKVAARQVGGGNLGHILKRREKYSSCILTRLRGDFADLEKLVRRFGSPCGSRIR